MIPRPGGDNENQKHRGRKNCYPGGSAKQSGQLLARTPEQVGGEKQHSSHSPTSRGLSTGPAFLDPQTQG